MDDMTSQRVGEMPCIKERAREEINKLIEKYERIKARNPHYFSKKKNKNKRKN